jgi:hypothetical protein
MSGSAFAQEKIGSWTAEALTLPTSVRAGGAGMINSVGEFSGGINGSPALLTLGGEGYFTASFFPTDPNVRPGILVDVPHTNFGAAVNVTRLLGLESFPLEIGVAFSRRELKLDTEISITDYTGQITGTFTPHETVDRIALGVGLDLGQLLLSAGVGKAAYTQNLFPVAYEDDLFDVGLLAQFGPIEMPGSTGEKLSVAPMVGVQARNLGSELISDFGNYELPRTLHFGGQFAVEYEKDGMALLRAVPKVAYLGQLDREQTSFGRDTSVFLHFYEDEFKYGLDVELFELASLRFGDGQNVHGVEKTIGAGISSAGLFKRLLPESSGLLRQLNISLDWAQIELFGEDIEYWELSISL